MPRKAADRQTWTWQLSYNGLDNIYIDRNNIYRQVENLLQVDQNRSHQAQLVCLPVPISARGQDEDEH